MTTNPPKPQSASVVLNVKFQNGDDVMVAGDSVRHKNHIASDCIDEVNVRGSNYDGIPGEPQDIDHADPVQGQEFTVTAKAEGKQSQADAVFEHEYDQYDQVQAVQADSGLRHNVTSDRREAAVPEFGVTCPKSLAGFSGLRTIENPHPLNLGGRPTSELRTGGNLTSIGYQVTRKSQIRYRLQWAIPVIVLFAIIFGLAVGNLVMTLQNKRSNEKLTADINSTPPPVMWNGWTVIQRRVDGAVDFFRPWVDYVAGFGQKDKDFWLGLETMHRLTRDGDHELRVDMMDWNGSAAFAHYDSFIVDDGASKYTLHVSGYRGTAGDSLDRHDGLPFSSLDQDNDNHLAGNCAHFFRGGWWHDDCFDANLNGVYNFTTANDPQDWVVWLQWTGDYIPLKFVEMKIRKKAQGV